MSHVRHITALLLVCWASAGAAADGKDEQQDRSWRALPLIKDGRVDPAWTQIGWGGFVVDDGSLRTECDQKGMGLLLYSREKFGDCQIRVVFRSRDARSNAGVFVRVDDGILDRGKEKPAAVRRDEAGKLTETELNKLKEASAKEQGPWYAVHHGYEVQICDAGDEYHRTGAIYSLAQAAPAPAKRPTDWKTMVITLKGNLVLVEVDGKQVTTYDPDGKDVPRRKQWHEPQREPKRPRAGYIGLQNHDPGDVVYFKEVSVRPLDGQAPPPKPDETGWKKLFDGKSLDGWKAADFTGAGKVHVKDGTVVMEKGKKMTGVTYAGKDFPKIDYEVTLEGKKLDGEDFFATTTFPVGDSYCSLVVGGWGGWVVGLSSIDGADASENETNQSKEFKKDRWYKLRLRVSQKRIEAWIDGEKLVDLDTTDRRLSIRLECRACRPFGVATYDTTGAVRDVRVRTLTEADKKTIGKKE